MHAPHRFLVVLPLLIPATSPGAELGKREVAVLTLRHDNIHGGDTAELIPLARFERGRFQAFYGKLRADQDDCPTLDFQGWKKPGTRYDVFRHGSRIGFATARERGVGAYSCDGLCAVGVDTDVTAAADGRLDSRRGIEGRELFDESIVQLVALTPMPTPSKPAVAATIDDRLQHSLADFARTGLRPCEESVASRAQVEILSLHAFRAGASDQHVFIVAERQGEDPPLRILSAVVRSRPDKSLEVLFESITDGDLDRGADGYEFVDTLDIEGDGRSEVLVIYQGYEFHEFQILRFTGKRYEVVHKGPSYGC